MSAYVIKSWKCQETTSPVDPYLVNIECRSEGFISWVLGLLQISPNIVFRVSSEKVEFEEGSLAGSKRMVTPLAKICTTYFGYQKPWREALVLAVAAAAFLAMLLSMGLGIVGAAIGAILGINVGGIFYFLNKTLTIGYSDDGGDKYSISFKRSLIENQTIDEVAAAHVCELIQRAADESQAKSSQRPPTGTPHSTA